MSVKKTIAIVGATENPGKEIANQFAFSGYRLLLVSNDINKLKQLTADIAVRKPKAEIDSIECVKDGCWEADIIILAVSYDKIKEVARLMKEVATQKIVVTILGEEGIETELKKILPHSKLVKVSGILQSKEIMVGGEDNTVNEEISLIFNEAGYHTTIENHSLRSN